MVNIICKVIGILLILIISLFINKLYEIMIKTPRPDDRGYIALGIIAEMVTVVWIIFQIVIK